MSETRPGAHVWYTKVRGVHVSGNMSAHFVLTRKKKGKGRAASRRGGEGGRASRRSAARRARAGEDLRGEGGSAKTPARAHAESQEAPGAHGAGDLLEHDEQDKQAHLKEHDQNQLGVFQGLDDSGDGRVDRAEFKKGLAMILAKADFELTAKEMSQVFHHRRRQFGAHLLQGVWDRAQKL